MQDIDLNKEIDGRPPLHYAADYGQEHVIQYLISKGADVNVSIFWNICLFKVSWNFTSKKYLQYFGKHEKRLFVYKNKAYVYKSDYGGGGGHRPEHCLHNQ